jgi:hypothetical protein
MPCFPKRFDLSPIIHKEIKDSIKISKSKLTLTLIDLGYTYKKIGDNRRVLYDQVSIINDTCYTIWRPFWFAMVAILNQKWPPKYKNPPILGEIWFPSRL